MSKVALIRQPAGLGDIFWLQPLVDHIASRGFTVIYPLCDHYYDMFSSSIVTNNSNFVRESDLDGKLLDTYSQTDHIIEDDFEYYPFDCITDPTAKGFRDEYSSFSALERKYVYYRDINPDGTAVEPNWKDCIKIQRDFSREKIYEDFCEISSTDEYVWVNRVFGTPPGVVYRDIDLPENIKIVENLSLMENIFDVCGVLEKAKSIHTVETSFSWIIELLGIESDLNLYPRINRGEICTDHDYINSLYGDNWKKHGLS
tara:strand:- start:11360 stop:12133 length:774 start_codon:yes stop_codon:yes gene_type:complete